MSLDLKIYIVTAGHEMVVVINEREHIAIVDFGVDKYSCLKTPIVLKE